MNKAQEYLVAWTLADRKLNNPIDYPAINASDVMIAFSNREIAELKSNSVPISKLEGLIININLLNDIEINQDVLSTRVNIKTTLEQLIKEVKDE